MNSIHDMGGMDGFGPIEREDNEPVFHAPWESRVYALFRRIGRWGRGRNWGSGRYALESIPPADYLRMSYYEKWFTMLAGRLVNVGLVTEEELASGQADPGRPRPVLHPAAPSAPDEGAHVQPRFRVRQRVRSRNLHPEGHTRQPRYTRGRVGTVARIHGLWSLQDTDTDGQRLDARLQHVYLVRFEGEELWGDRADERDAVYVDLWEDYLEPA